MATHTLKIKGIGANSGRYDTLPFDDNLGATVNGASRYGEIEPFQLRVTEDGKLLSKQATYNKLLQIADTLPAWVEVPNLTIWLDRLGNPTTIPDRFSTEVPNPAYLPALQLYNENKATYGNMLRSLLTLCCTRLFPAIYAGEWEFRIDGVLITDIGSHYLYLKDKTKYKSLIRSLPYNPLHHKWGWFVNQTFPLSGEARIKKLAGL